MAEDLTEKIEETEQISNKVKRLLDLAKALVHAGHKNKARPIFVKVRKLATAIKDKNHWQRVEILRALAILQAQSGNEFANKSEQVFNELEKLAEGKAQSLLDLANDLAKAGNVKKSEAVFCKAINVPNSIEDGWQRTAILRIFVEELVGAGFTEEAVKYFEEARNAIQAISNENKFAKAEELRKLATALVKVPEQAREVFAEAEELAPHIEQGLYAEEVLSQWAVILAEAGFPGKARAISHNFDEAKQQMDEDRKYPGEIIERANSNKRTLTKTKFLEEIDQARNSTEVREIAKTAIESKAFRQSNLAGLESTLGHLVIDIAEEMKFSTAKKVAYAIEDENNLKQINVLRELAKVVAWLGDFREAFTIFGLKNGLIQFLDHLGYWIWASEKVKQDLSIEILQETTRIFGWTYPYWGKIYEQSVSASNEGYSPNLEKPITSLHNKQKEELDSQNLDINNILTTIPTEQAQRFEAYIQEAEARIQEAVDILYQNIAIRESTSLSNIKEAVLRQIIQSLSINSFK
ncbi:tetratricopeptide repeat protein [Nostoc sp.]|uniref:tetratricopeptide repeat protein n=1 Tax=Nostoc sp. TaxID=1180 RepID=UPI002FF5F8F4